MKIECEAMKGQDLLPGDLFSTAGPEYWETIDLNMSIGEKCYIRTNTEPGLAAADSVVYRLKILRDPRNLVRCEDCGAMAADPDSIPHVMDCAAAS